MSKAVLSLGSALLMLALLLPPAQAQVASGTILQGSNVTGLKERIANLRSQILTANPALGTEETDLLAQMKVAATPGRNDADTNIMLHEKWVLHEQNVREKAIAVDPQLSAYF
jgi:hypothetical protein